MGTNYSFVFHDYYCILTATMSKLTKNILFYSHMVIWLPVYFIPFILPFWVVVLFVTLYDMHLIAIDGCVLTKLQQKFNILGKDEEYYQVFFKKVFRIKLTDENVFHITKITEYYLILASLFMYLIK